MNKNRILFSYVIFTMKREKKNNNEMEIFFFKETLFWAPIHFEISLFLFLFSDCPLILFYWHF